MKGEEDLDFLSLSELQKQFFLSVKRGKIPKSITNTMFMTSMKKGFLKLKENTSMSPSKRHLGHYNSMLILDNNTQDKTIDEFNNTMSYVYNMMINTSLHLGYTLTR